MADNNKKKEVLMFALWSVIYIFAVRLATISYWEFNILEPKHWKYIYNMWQKGWVISSAYEWSFFFTILLTLPMWIIGYNLAKDAGKSEKVKKLGKKTLVYLKTIKNIPKSIKEAHIKAEKGEASEEKEDDGLVKMPDGRLLPKEKAAEIEAEKEKAKEKARQREEEEIIEKPYELLRNKYKEAHILEESNDSDTQNKKKIINDSEEDSSSSEEKSEKIDLSKIMQDLEREKAEIENSRHNNNTEDNDDDSIEIEEDDDEKPDIENMLSPGNFKLPPPPPIIFERILSRANYKTLANVKTNNDKIDFIGISEEEIVLLNIDYTDNDWLADEKSLKGKPPLWFAEDKHINSPVYVLNQYRKELENKLSKEFSDKKIKTIFCVASGSILNAKDMMNIWKKTETEIVRFGAGGPRNLKNIVDLIKPETKTEINDEAFEKIKQIINS